MGFARFAATAALLCLFLGLSLPLTPGLVDWLMNGGRPDQNSGHYVAQVFDDILPYDRVLSSRYLKGTARRCTHAIVRLGDHPPTDPPRAPIKMNREFRFGGLWRPTPVLAPDGVDLLEACRNEIGGQWTDQLKDLLGAPGAYYVRDLSDGSLHVYAPTARIAARVGGTAKSWF